ncbi:M1 family metallopeptidase [Rubrivivax gelatinosus]|nr:M1 family metallopeptidase [Rubrivivax gelatinosus]
MSLRFLRTFAAAAALAAGAALAQPRFDFDRTPGTLPKTVLPSRYTITLDLDPAAERFSGQASIALRLRRAVPEIVLHAYTLQPRGATLKAGGRDRALTVTADEATQTWRLVPADGRPLPAGTATLELAWDGTVQRSGSGLYRAPYGGGRAGAMLATQLEAVFARMVFPAFDEPSFRAVFELAVRTPVGVEVVSNTAERSVVDDGGRRLHRFEPTPPMPSYLVALAAGRFDTLAGRAAGVPLRILTAPGKAAQGAYALEVTERVLPFYSAYFGQRYALPKLDQLAVPSTRFGAMEDWGLISYAENTLLFDPAHSDTNTRRRIFSIVAHEVAHQWFGNLVTAASWEEIWLNEAFATWMAEKATERFNPEWNIALRRRGPIDDAMTRDAGDSTRAIRSGPVPEDRVFDVFDDITYVKGGAVLAMLEQWIGPKALRNGLAGYMAERRLSNATAGDLWHHIGRASGRNVAAVATSWTDQPGFPLVQAESRCEHGRTRLELSQRRFTLDGHDAPGLWKLPLVVQHGGRTSSLLLDGVRTSTTLAGCPATPTLLNPGGQGFYRVAYAPDWHAALAARFAELPGTAQATLLADTLALAQSGRLPMASLIELLAQLPSVQGPTRPALYAQARRAFEFLDESLHDSPAQAPLHAAARALFAPELATLGWTPRAGEGSEAEQLRNGLIADLAAYGDEAVIARAGELFDAELAGRAPLPPAIRQGVVSAVGRHADEARFAALLARLDAAASEEERWLYASAIAEVPDAALARRLLARTLDGTLPTNIATTLPQMVGQAPGHEQLAYDFVVAEFARLGELAGPMFGARAWLLPGTVAASADAGVARRMLADQQRLVGTPGAATAARAAARITLRAQVRAAEAQRLAPALQALASRLAPA